ncbi:hypothetical protein H5410_021881 [Solanum commersonii]|uniref:Uncharacterized protein n=1 Tax=Solanum commersonii TaxID=4109 RepID=A0A9J5ZFJ8_SOLCO|nr:hypothetical protein H5410_021881 [Solanum commersonii]
MRRIIESDGSWARLDNAITEERLVEEIIGFCKGSFRLTYVGCHIGRAKKKKIHFKELIKKIQNKLQMFKGKLPSVMTRKFMANVSSP